MLRVIKTCDTFMHADCSGAQHEDCARLLQRLQAAAKQPVASSRGANNAPPASPTAVGQSNLSPDMAQVPSLSTAALESVLAVHNSKTEGRQLAVTRDKAAGTVLWTEQPYVHVLLKQHRKQVYLVVMLEQMLYHHAVTLHSVIAEHLFCMLWLMVPRLHAASQQCTCTSTCMVAEYLLDDTLPCTVEVQPLSEAATGPGKLLLPSLFYGTLLYSQVQRERHFPQTRRS